ncbi:MAG: A/G-specific adenine glycosylase [Bacteroidota bacterium]
MEPWFSQKLIKWYNLNKRDLPWRHETDPYKIWLSEIILQQTQVAQGLSYYNNFTRKYPNVKSLAKAAEDDVLKLWQGLGYYSRARNLHATAKIISNEFNGAFPHSYPDILALKGVGDYTAAAITSFAFNQPYAVVDGNVYRVLSRIFGIETPIDSSSAKKEFQALASGLLNKKMPALHNQAIMEFGSQYCRPVNPDCENCVFKDKCYAIQNGKVGSLPLKSKKIKIKNRFFNYLVIADKNNKIRINRREGNDIWQGLYEFCLLETPKEFPQNELFALPGFKSLCGSGFTLLHVSGSYKHVLTHQHLFARFYVIRVNKVFGAKVPAADLKTLEKIAFSRLTEKFREHCVLKELF